MNNYFEMLENKYPFDISLNSVRYVPNHWHNSIEIIFVLKGNLEVKVNDNNFAISEGDVILINYGQIHEVIGLGMNIIATLQIPNTFLKANVKGFESLTFDCYSRNIKQEKREAMFSIRKLLAEMILIVHRRGEAFQLEVSSRMLELISILIKQFKAGAASRVFNEKNMERMLRIISFIDSHSQEQITLQTISEREYLSVPYLSKFFKENIGINFHSYLTNIRLRNAVEDLLINKDKTIADIASLYGFPTTKSFYEAFKEKYHVTPNEYRKRYLPKLNEKDEKSSKNYLNFSPSRALGIINQFLQRTEFFNVPYISSLETKTFSVDMVKDVKEINHTWKSLITIGKAKEGLHNDVQEQLRYVQNKCPFKYLRFHGIFDDQMMVYYEDKEGNPTYNFRYVDQLFDFLLSIGLKPFVELGFMPSDLASDKTKTVFYMKSNTSGPKSIDRWCDLINHFIRHCLNRYGLDEVVSWKFEFWNEPEFHSFWSGTVLEYFEFYRSTYNTIKLVSPRLQIGAPGRTIPPISTNYGTKFFDYCREHNCLPDFIPVHFYPLEVISQNINKENNGQPFLNQVYESFNNSLRISPNPDYLMESLENEKKMLENQNLSELDVYLTEWNSTTYHRDLTNDTLYKAAYIAKNVVENLDRISGFGYWVLSDNIEEAAAPPQLFHGGLGLIAQFGIPKAGMVVFELLAKLGDYLVEKDRGYIVTKRNESYQILTYNYCHFDELYSMGDTSFINETNRYHGFREEKMVKMEIELTGLPKGNYKLVTVSVDRKNGSSYDMWVEMGAPKQLTKDDINYLKTASQPRRQIQYLDVNGDLTIVSTLVPHAVSLTELIPIY